MADALPAAIITKRMRAALRARFDDVARYALVEEVANGTGWQNDGWCDAVCVALWPSDGLQVTGFEIKASRDDWRRELLAPWKAERIAQHCDAWVVVAAKGVVLPGELRRGWGLLVYDADADTLTQRVKPQVKKGRVPLDRAFMAALMRRVRDTAPMARHLYREAQRRARIRVHTKRSAILRESDRLRLSFDTLKHLLRERGLVYDVKRRKLSEHPPR